jgi:hypothetical protein
VAGGVELIDRADQPDAERGLDLGSLADLEEPVESLEDLHILPAGRGRPDLVSFALALIIHGG